MMVITSVIILDSEILIYNLDKIYIFIETQQSRVPVIHS